mmetsp:Transcript_47216/g.119540  ORF Transcript_47216/g.119540 Transcript_47216/m.119540 type:complete len:224 (-) Transcript_47216:118-789(-)
MSTIVLAQVAERAGRYDDMADYMKERAEQGAPLNSEERDMFSAAFKNALTERRQAVRVALSMAQHEVHAGRQSQSDLALGYKSKVASELQEICNKALSVLESHLVASAVDPESKTFFLKMQGDYYRYLAEFAEGDARAKAATSAAAAYGAGMQAALGLSPVHAGRLGLALNFSVFLHEVIQDNEAAKRTASQAYDEGAQHEGSANDDAALTLNLLADNLQLWC